MTSVLWRKNKQIKTCETDVGWHEAKHILLAKMNVKLYSWPVTFRKVVRQQIGEAAETRGAYCSKLSACHTKDASAFC